MEGNLSTWASITRVGELQKPPGSWFWPAPGSATAATWEIEQADGESPFVFLYITLPFK